MARAMQNLRFWIEAGGAIFAYGVLRALPMRVSAALGEAAMRWVGPLLPLHRIAGDNLRAAFPDKDQAWIDAVRDGMWRNLGRTAGEFPHLSRLKAQVGREVEVVGGDVIDRIKADGGPVIFLSGHMANWELMAVVGAHYDIPVDLVYRAPNNPLIRRLYNKRKPHPDSRLIPKGKDGARQIIRSLKQKRIVGMLVDQKMNDGIEARFFGMPAMTASAFAPLAARAECPLIMARVERVSGSGFKVTVGEPIEVITTGDPEADQLALIQMVNDTLEGWIRERPEQWLWVHRRWPKQVIADRLKPKV
jgi:KDO2-lipid IV(A) lauroyltransferase